MVDDDSVGHDFLEQVARDWPDVVRVLWSAACQAILSRTNGARLLPKPCDPVILHIVLREAMQQATATFTARVYVALQPSANSSIGCAEFRQNDVSNPIPAVLSRREREIRTLLVQGLGTAHIARRLSISVFTVRNHVKSIYEKLGIHSRQELAQAKPLPGTLDS
jgi:DNA-binding NarL/FixJ family response regulator